MSQNSQKISKNLRSIAVGSYQLHVNLYINFKYKQTPSTKQKFTRFSLKKPEV